MTAKKYECETMFDAPEPYGIMVETNDGSYVSADDYETLKEVAIELFTATTIGVRNCTAERVAKEKLARLLGIFAEPETTQSPSVEDNSTVTVEIKFREFDGDEASADKLYGNPAYDDSFQFKVKDSDVIYTGNLGWEQGRFNNYRFYVGCDGSNNWYSPSDVTHIEVK